MSPCAFSGLASSFRGAPSASQRGRPIRGAGPMARMMAAGTFSATCNSRVSSELWMASGAKIAGRATPACASVCANSARSMKEIAPDAARDAFLFRRHKADARRSIGLDAGRADGEQRLRSILAAHRPLPVRIMVQSWWWSTEPAPTPAGGNKGRDMPPCPKPSGSGARSRRWQLSTLPAHLQPPQAARSTWRTNPASDLKATTNGADPSHMS